MIYNLYILFLQTLKRNVISSLGKDVAKVKSCYRKVETPNTSTRLSDAEITATKKVLWKAFLQSFLETIKPLISLTPPVWLHLPSTLKARDLIYLSGELNNTDIEVSLIRTVLKKLDVIGRSPPFPMIITQSEEKWKSVLMSIETASYMMCSIFTAQSTGLFFGSFINLMSAVRLCWLPSMAQLLICSQLELTVKASEQIECGIVTAIRTSAPTMNLLMRMSQWTFLEQSNLLHKAIQLLLEIPTESVVAAPQQPEQLLERRRRRRVSTPSTSATSSEEDSTSAEEQNIRGHTGTSSTIAHGIATRASALKSIYGKGYKSNVSKKTKRKENDISYPCSSILDRDQGMLYSYKRAPPPNSKDQDAVGPQQKRAKFVIQTKLWSTREFMRASPLNRWEKAIQAQQIVLDHQDPLWQSYKALVLQHKKLMEESGVEPKSFPEKSFNSR